MTKRLDCFQNIVIEIGQVLNDFSKDFFQEMMLEIGTPFIFFIEY